MPQQVIIISGASTGFGALAARLMARNGHRVYAGVREHEAEEIAATETFAKEHGVDLRPLILDITNTDIVNAAVERVMSESSRIDVLHHNAGRSVLGPAESFTPEEVMKYLDLNYVGAQRLMRAALPHMRKARTGLVMWTSSSSVKGGTTPFVGHYFAAKSALDMLAVSYAGELVRWGIETSIVVPGVFPRGTNAFHSLALPEDKDLEAEYFEGPYKGYGQRLMKAFAEVFPQDADASDVAKLMARVVEMPQGTRPFRIHHDPLEDGSEIVSAMTDRFRKDMLVRTGFPDLVKLTPEAAERFRKQE
ncbi:hypothetical protein F66182_2533 [Fusarium sp. NRRL 66182]|nr:hypothetical protein F66182_2533 [Fusarium sp. NRRL 66182]